jgi:hypothetical protein
MLDGDWSSDVCSSDLEDNDQTTQYIELLNPVLETPATHKYLVVLMKALWLNTNS